MAAERGFFFVAVPRRDQTLRIQDVQGGQEVSFQIDPDLLPHSHWPNFPMTVARRLARNLGKEILGAEVAFASDLPRAAGMSSSSSMLIGFSLILIYLNQLYELEEFRKNIKSIEDLAEYFGVVENGQDFGTLRGDKGVGTFGGSEDHTAILCCLPGELSQYAFCPVRFERQISVPRNLAFVIGVSGVVADKTGEARDRYNRASRLASDAARIWRESGGFEDPHLAAAVARCEGGMEPIRKALEAAANPESRDLVARFEQFYFESEDILPQAADALAEGELGLFGSLVDRSQELAEELLGNQVAETAFLARTARRLGAHAASAFGAGFGGSVWALVERKEAQAWLEDWAQIYAQHYTEAAARSDFMITDVGPSALELTNQDQSFLKLLPRQNN
jgi:galactokinase